MNFLRNHEYHIFLFLLVIGLFGMAAGTAQDFRGGNESAFTNHSVREVLAAIVGGK